MPCAYRRKDRRGGWGERRPFCGPTLPPPVRFHAAPSASSLIGRPRPDRLGPPQQRKPAGRYYAPVAGVGTEEGLGHRDGRERQSEGPEPRSVVVGVAWGLRPHDRSRCVEHGGGAGVLSMV